MKSIALILAASWSLVSCTSVHTPSPGDVIPRSSNPAAATAAGEIILRYHVDKRGFPTGIQLQSARGWTRMEQAVISQWRATKHTPDGLPRSYRREVRLKYE